MGIWMGSEDVTRSFRIAILSTFPKDVPISICPYIFVFSPTFCIALYISYGNSRVARDGPDTQRGQARSLSAAHSH